MTIEQHDVERMIQCQSCGFLCPMEEFITNFGWCDNCFNDSYELYIEESAGPFDWLRQ